MKISEALTLTLEQFKRKTDGIWVHGSIAYAAMARFGRKTLWHFAICYIIDEKMNYCIDIEEWLAKQANIPRDTWVEQQRQLLGNIPYADKLQQTQINWLESLIAEYQAKGD